MMFWMTAKFDSRCADCRKSIEEGDRIVYDPGCKQAYCAECGPLTDAGGDDV